MSHQKSGWVYKQGGVTGTAWKKKYAVLQYNLLLVFDSEEDAAKKQKPKHTYNVSDAIIRPIEGMHKFGFQVQLSNDNETKSVNMAALDSNSLKEWTENIKEAAKPAPVVKAEEKKLPGRWDPPAQPKPAVSPSNPGGNVAVHSPAPVAAQPQPVMNYAQPQQMPVQQVPAQQAPPQQGPPQYNYNQYMNQQYQPQVQYQYQQQYQAPPPQYQQPYQPQYQQPYSPQQQPQYQQPQYQQPQYQPQPQYQQQYQQPQYQQQPSQPSHHQQLNSLMSQAPSAPTSAPVAFPSTPTEQPKTQTTSQSSMFPHLSQLQ